MMLAQLSLRPNCSSSRIIIDRLQSCFQAAKLSPSRCESTAAARTLVRFRFWMSTRRFVLCQSGPPAPPRPPTPAQKAETWDKWSQRSNKNVASASQVCGARRRRQDGSPSISAAVFGAWHLEELTFFITPGPT